MNQCTKQFENGEWKWRKQGDVGKITRRRKQHLNHTFQWRRETESLREKSNQLLRSYPLVIHSHPTLKTKPFNTHTHTYIYPSNSIQRAFLSPFTFFTSEISPVQLSKSNSFEVSIVLFSFSLSIHCVIFKKPDTKNVDVDHFL